MNRQVQSSSPAEYKRAVAEFIGIPIEKLPEGVEINVKNVIANIRKGRKVVIPYALAKKQTIKNTCNLVRIYKGYELHVEFQDGQSVITRL